MNNTHFEPIFPLPSLLPAPITCSIFCHSNSSTHKLYEPLPLSVDDISKLFIFWLQKAGSSDAAASDNLVVTPSEYFLERSKITVNELSSPQHEQESRKDYTHRSSLCAIQMLETFSKATSKVFFHFKVFIVDECSMSWGGKEKEESGCPHTTKNKNKVHSVAFEVKCANDNTTGVRFSTTPVLNKHESQQHREGSPTDAMIPNLSSFSSSSWRVVKLLSLANALRNAPRRPWMVIADSAFASVPLALEPPHTS